MKRVLPIALAAIAIVLSLVTFQAAIQTASNQEPVPVQAIYYKDKVIVLLYHDIRERLSDNTHQSGTVTVQQFRNHLQSLREQDYQIISMETFVNFMLHGGAVPSNAVVLTFDDGYESFYSKAFPVLCEYDATASNFIVGVSTDIYNPDAYTHLSWDQMRELKAAGMSIYSHSYNLHHIVSTDKSGHKEPGLIARQYLEQRKSRENESEHRNRISSDLRFMEKRLIQELGTATKLLAFPFGAYDDTAVEEAARSGTELFFTVEEGINRSGGRFVYRINAGEPYMTSDALLKHLKTIY
jgi:peptidoglycan/xylan/chitin deacetylase (PgdA/CDA1 family)